MTTSENHVETDAERTPWWMFWRVLPTRLRRRRSRLSDEANSDATSFWIRGGF